MFYGIGDSPGDIMLGGMVCADTRWARMCSEASVSQQLPWGPQDNTHTHGAREAALSLALQFPQDVRRGCRALNRDRKDIQDYMNRLLSSIHFPTVAPGT